MRHLALLILSIGVFANPAAAQEDEREDVQLDVERHDTNNDGYVTEAEWQDAGNAAGDFADLDQNSDGYLDESEMRSAANNVRDDNADAATVDVTPEDDYLGTGHDPLSADPADNEPVSQETEAAAAGDSDGDDSSAAQATPIDNSLFTADERNGEQSFSQIDSSGDGRVSRQEAEQDDQVQENFIAWDSNQDGYLDEAEIDAGRNQGNMQEQQDISFSEEDPASRNNRNDSRNEDDGDRITRDEVADTAEFDTLDVNNDGYLDEAEVNYDPGERSMADAAGFQSLDTDNDSRLSRREAATDAYIDANFDSWDNDGDGYLDEDELNNGWLEESGTTSGEID